MKKLVFLALFLLLAGCMKTTDALYLEGTETTLGIFLPYDGTIYGLQAMHYMNGTAVCLKTNCPPFKLVRVHCATNSYFGVVKTQESTHTEFETR